MSRVLLFECSPRRPSDGVVVPVRLAWKSPGQANHLGQQWEPVVESPPGLVSAIGFDGREFGASPLPQVGELSFALTDRTRHVAGLVWKNAAVVIRSAPWPAGGGNPVAGAFSIVWTGAAEAAPCANGLCRVALVDAGQALRAPVLTAKFGGTGIAMLDSADAVRDRAADALVPAAWGRPLGIPGTQIDRANGIWLFSGRPATAVTAFYDGGAAFTLGVARASLAALIANAPAEGAVDYCLDAGGAFIARPWRPPTFPFTVDATFGSARAADIASTIVAARGGPAFTAGTVAAFNALQASDCGLYLDDATTIDKALDELFTGLGAFWRLRAAGTIDLRRVGFATPIMTVAAHLRAAPERQRIIVPTGRRSLGYARNNKVHSEGDIAAIVTATDVVYVDGTLVEALKPATPGATRNIPRGVHNNTLTYSQYDTVTTAANDKLYSAKIDVPTGIALSNTVYWQLEIVSGAGAAGANAVQVRLDNPVIFVATAADGSGGSYSGLTCQVEVYDGPTRRDTVPGLVTYAIVGTPAFASISSAGLVTITNWGSTAVDVKIDATYAGVTYRTTLALRRSLGGVAGPALVMSGGGAFEFVDGAATPGQTRTFTIIRQNAIGTAVWTTVPGGITLTGTGDSRTLAVADMAGNRQVTVRATVGSVYDEDTAIRVDRSTADAGANLTAPANANRVPFSRFERGMGDWPITLNTGGVSVTPFAAEVEGFRVGTYQFAFTAAGQNCALRSAVFPVQGGERLSIQARLGIEIAVSVASWAFFILYFDQSGGFISGASPFTGGANPAWRDPPLQAFDMAPANARTAYIQFNVNSAAAGAALAVVANPLVTSAIANQTTHPTFTPGPNAQDGADVTGLNTALNTQNVAGQTAAALVAQAATAASDSASALSQISIIASDSVLDRSEKPGEYQRWLGLQTERATIIATATELGITTPLTDYNSANTALDTYLGGLSPGWNDRNTDTPIVRGTFEGRFADVYFTRQVLLDAIARVGVQRATWASVSGNGRPEDGATLGSNKVSNAGLIGGTAEWVLNPGITRVAALASDPGNYLSFATGATRFAQTNGGAARRIDGGPLFWQAWTYIVSTATTSMTALFNWFRADGSPASTALTSINIAPAVAAVWVQNRGKVTPPADAVSFRLDFGVTAVGGVALVAGAAVSNSEAGADITTAQPIVSRLSSATGQALDTFVLSTGLPPSQIVARGEARHGQMVVFSPPFSGIPEIIYLPGGNTGVAGQNNLIAPVGLTASGFVQRAVTQSVTPGTTITDTGATAGGAGEPDLVMNRSSGSAPFDGRFTYTFPVNVGDIAPGEPGFVNVGLFVRQSGAWVQVGSISRATSSTVIVSVSPAIVDFGAGNEFGIDLLGAAGAGSGIAGFTSVEYTPGTVTETSLTPVGASAIPFLVVL